MTEQRQPTLPTVSLLQGRPYTDSWNTDIRRTFALFGWQPKEKPSCATTGMPS
jgi:hypothetical protein